MKFKGSITIEFFYEVEDPEPAYETTDPRKCAEVDLKSAREDFHLFLASMDEDGNVTKDETRIWALDETRTWLSGNDSSLDHREKP